MAKTANFRITDGLFGNAREMTPGEAAPAAAPSPVPSPVPFGYAPVSNSAAYTGKLGSTQGKKGQKLPRINMAFDQDIHEYIKREARRRGETITEFVNYIIRKYMESPDGHVD